MFLYIVSIHINFHQNQFINECDWKKNLNSDNFYNSELLEVIGVIYASRTMGTVRIRIVKYKEENFFKTVFYPVFMAIKKLNLIVIRL